MTLSKFIELYGGFIGGVLLVAALFGLTGVPAYNSYVAAFRAIPSVTGCIFGFVLALFGLIIQGDGPIIQKMKIRKVLFNRYISFTKRIIWISLFLTVYSLVLAYVNPEWVRNILRVGVAVLKIFKVICIGTMFTFSFWLITDLIIFVNLFFLLIRMTK